MHGNDTDINKVQIEKILTKFFISILIIPFLFIFILSSFARENLPTIESIDCQNLQNSAKINISISGEKADILTYELESPHRIIVDFMGPAYTDIPHSVTFDEGMVTAIDAVEVLGDSTPGLDESFYSVDFIVITLRDPIGYAVNQQDNLITLEIGDFENESKMPPQAKVEQPQVLQEEEKPYMAADAQQYPIAQPDLFALLNDLKCENSSASAKVTFVTDKPIDPLVYETENPKELFIDANTDLFSKVSNDIEFDKGILKSVRVIQKAGSAPDGIGQEYYPVDFMVFIFNEPVGYDIVRNQNEVAIAFKAIKGEGETMEQQVPPDTYITEQPQPPPAKEELVQEEKEIREAEEEAVPDIKEQSLVPKEPAFKEGAVISAPKAEQILSACVHIGLLNNRLAKISLQEIELAKFKVRDARRALFPTATLKSSWTVGTSTSLGFAEKTYGVDVSQPIYVGGKLWNTLKQTKVSVEMAKKKYDKVEADVSYDVSQRYYELITAKATLGIQQDLAKEAKPIYEDAKSRFAQELITQIDYMNVEATYNQILLQVATAQKDVDLAELKLKHVTNLKSIEALEVPSIFDIDYVNRDIDVNEAFKIALDNRPEVFLDRFLIDFNRYEELIAKSKNDFKVDFTGFYGRSGSEYTDEKFKRDLDWYAGFKVSKPFFGSTISYSWTKNQGPAKLGENSRTQGTTDTVEMSVFDKFSNATEIEQAQIAYKKALNDFSETVKGVELEVQEAYNAYEKAVLSMDNEREKVELKEKQMKITEFEASLNDVSPGQLMDTKVKLADEKGSYIQAVSTYKISIAKLNKAVGIRDYYR